MDDSLESSARDASGAVATASSDPNEPTRQKRHNKRWEDDETLLFIQAWEEVLENVRSSSAIIAEGSESKDESHLALSGRIFQLFSALQGGSTIRSEHAVNTKMTTLEMSFQFITKFNRALSLQGDCRDWFSLSKAEKRDVKEANCLDNRMIDLSRTVYEALRAVVHCEVERDADDADSSASYPIDSDDEFNFPNGDGVHHSHSNAARSSQASVQNSENTEATVRAHKKRKLQHLKAAIAHQDAQVKELLAEMRLEREERKRESKLKEQARQKREVERQREREEDREMMWALINELKRQNEKTERANW